MEIYNYVGCFGYIIVYFSPTWLSLRDTYGILTVYHYINRIAWQSLTVDIDLTFSCRNIENQ